MTTTSDPTTQAAAPAADRPETAAAPAPAPAAATATTGPARPGPRIDVTALHDSLLGRWPQWRSAARAHAAEPRFWKDESLSMAEHRKRVLAQCHQLAEDPRHQVWLGFPERLGGGGSPGANLAGFEELAIGDPSLQIKAGVQWGLFASAIWQLGTPEQQDRWLPGAMDLSVPGAFAMTETGHGSDVAAVGTTATYDPDTQEFVIHTPFRGAWKDYLGNGAEDGLAATVFARLVTGGVDYGVHCFYVPIRSSDGEFLPGVGGEDDGLKGGLRGIDNGRLWFDQVRVPRENLLARYGQVAEDGTYTSPIASPGRRFFTMLGALVQGRVSLDGAAGTASRIGLAIAVRYGSVRRQFAAATPDEEVVLLDYATHRRRLIPRIAETYALHYAHERLLDLFDDVFSGREDTEDKRADLETMAAAMKATSTAFALDTLQECREACGGAGFLTENRITSLRADLDVYATFEGDNTVLLQLVAKRLVGDFGKSLGAQVTTPEGKARFVAGRAVDTLLHRTPLRRAAQTVADVVTRPGAVFDVETQRALLADRVAAKVEAVALALRPARKADPVTAQRIFDRHQVALLDAARSHAEQVRWELFTEAVDATPDAGTRTVLGWLRDVYALTVVERDLGWFVVNGRLAASRARALEAELDALLRRLRPHALDLVAAWGLTDDHLRAAVATGAEKARQDEAREYYAAQRAAGTAPQTEKSARKSAKS
ncbi:acyl-CoA oxidase domain protein [Xylanimonas cellulosilytica DSM 15894]|uniref:acyl-CoA oxidase n=1 Tax=Xylanimonas cellulosilytica (strain DSM 15894 / JCM 12276 / CECT 5975 / KCTC 9989 / LMG 20990 / NBRC 107835 / XIL07) TaxID=446471 RepID=D1BZY4_XYLCX|nr:acyl-CoA dehydrogenase [Xylanimonas cellulosilytica]ACZ32112.1 acyl-CoA oxidase domain protein [Xylanimonas cellulosilytica DSM 15894]